MSASRNNRFARYFRYIPSKTLSFDYIRSEDKVFFDALGAEGIMARLDSAIDSCRERIAEGRYPEETLSREFLLLEILNAVRGAAAAESKEFRSVIKVVNATGIVIHTNLGRAPLPEPGESFRAVSGGYSNLEFDLATGGRGKRDRHVSALLAKLTGAEDSIVVNNNASAVLLVARTFSNRREAVIARGESVEIGEGFRITEMLRIGGARIVDVGATNSVKVSDYEDAVNEKTGLIVKVHPSNFTLSGFVRQIDPALVPALASKHGVVSYFDAGSGLVSSGIFEGLKVVSDEPEVRSLIAAGFDVVSFSGDKLFGSVQCGIICGRADLIAKMRRNQLYRALRVSKAVIASLQDAACEYLFGDPGRKIPVVRMLNESGEKIEIRALNFLETVSGFAQYRAAKKFMATEIVTGRAMAGGGTTPGATLENKVLRIRFLKNAPAGANLASLAAAMRRATIPVIGYVDSNSYFLNFRTISDGEVAYAAASFAFALGEIFNFSE